MRTFRHVTPPFRVYYGEASLQQLAPELERLRCRRAVVFCGRTIAQHDEALGLVREALGARYAGVFDGVKAHSPLPAVLAGAEALRALAADAVIAVGGGSAVVTARAAAILLAEARDISELCTQFPRGKPPVSPKLARPKLPQLVVPTTPTTAYAKAGSAVFDPALGQRRALFDPKTRAVSLFIHPALALTAPMALARDAGVQALAMAVQGLESNSRDPLADALLLHALRVLAANLSALMRQPQAAETRGQLMLGALLAGHGSDYAPPGLASTLAHVVGARFHLENGVTNAIVLPHAMRFNASATHERVALIAEALGSTLGGLGEDALAAATGALEALCAELGLPRRLRDTGVTPEALPQLAHDAAGDWFLHQNPRKVRDESDILEVLQAAF